MVWRVCSACRATRSQAGSKKHTNLPRLSDTLLPAETNETLELDELWSFVGFKKNKRWICPSLRVDARLAMCRRTRQIVAYAIGDRSEATCRLLWEQVPQAYKGGVVYTDFWNAYQKVIPAEQHQAVGKESGQTNHIERWNNTLRQRVARFVRKTLAFSKTQAMHECCLRLFLCHERCNIGSAPHCVKSARFPCVSLAAKHAVATRETYWC